MPDSKLNGSLIKKLSISVAELCYDAMRIILCYDLEHRNVINLCYDHEHLNVMF